MKSNSKPPSRSSSPTKNQPKEEKQQTHVAATNEEPKQSPAIAPSPVKKETPKQTKENPNVSQPAGTFTETQQHLDARATLSPVIPIPIPQNILHAAPKVGTTPTESPAKPAPQSPPLSRKGSPFNKLATLPEDIIAHDLKLESTKTEQVAPSTVEQKTSQQIKITVTAPTQTQHQAAEPSPATKRSPHTLTSPTLAQHITAKATSSATPAKPASQSPQALPPSVERKSPLAQPVRQEAIIQTLETQDLAANQSAQNTAYLQAILKSPKILAPNPTPVSVNGQSNHQEIKIESKHEKSQLHEVAPAELDKPQGWFTRFFCCSSSAAASAAKNQAGNANKPEEHKHQSPTLRGFN